MNLAKTLLSRSVSPHTRRGAFRSGAQRFIHGEEQHRRVFASYNVWGEQSSLKVSAIPPEFKEYGNSGDLALKKPGSILLDLIPKSGSDWDWKSRLSFALRPSEIGVVMSAIREAPSQVTIKRTSQDQDAGAKNLSVITTTSADGRCVERVQFRIEEHDRHVSIDMEMHEFYVVEKIMDFFLPRLLGMDMVL